MLPTANVLGGPYRQSFFDELADAGTIIFGITLQSRLMPSRQFHGHQGAVVSVYLGELLREHGVALECTGCGQRGQRSFESRTGGRFAAFVVNSADPA